jgi:hypothetical protein
MFEALLFAVPVICLIGIACALDGSRDIFHPLVFILPMLGFLYFWMPYQIWSAHGLEKYFEGNQLTFVQLVNVVGVIAFMLGCLFAGLRLRRPASPRMPPLSQLALRRMLVGSGITGMIGLGCWGITIINVGGFVNAYSKSYSGGWDDSGYVRDGSLLLLVGVLLAITVLSSNGPRLQSVLLIGLFSFPWLSQALLMARRGPTFAFVVIVLMGWFTTTRKRPPVFAAGSLAVALGWLVLFLVTNRGSIYLGSSFDVKTDVSGVVDTADTGNEYIYGSGTILASIRRDHYFWMRRYLSQILVRPIPTAIWPTKYEDFGVPEMLNNAGTGEGFADALGWVGAPGSAPGIIADLWVEVWWFAVLLMALLGYGYGFVWRKAVLEGGPWASQYVLISALSIYLVMQTMEAVIFRTLLLSIPCWITWNWALRSPFKTRRAVRDTRLPLRSEQGYEHV